MSHVCFFPSCNLHNLTDVLDGIQPDLLRKIEEVVLLQCKRAGVLVRKWFGLIRCSICVLQAEKAEGYIDLTNFMIDRAIECKKKQ